MKQLTIVFGPNLSPPVRLLAALALCLPLCAVLILSGTTQQSRALASPGSHKSGLQVVNYVTWWSLDPEGYHPAILLKVENLTGRDLTGQLMRFQGRFIDLRTSQVTVARDQQQRQFVPRQVIYVSLRGQDAFELPLNSTSWPMLEGKVMYRIGDVGDEETQTLLITNVERIAMSDDDAKSALEKMREFTQTSAPAYEEHQKPAVSSHSAAAPPSDGGLTALPGKLKSGKKSESGGMSSSLTASPNTPGLGDDFALFEKAFGLPIATATDSKGEGWTWASYRQSNSPAIVYAGSKGHTGKVDVLIVKQPGTRLDQETVAIDAAKALAGKFKDQQLSESSRSVRYLQSGRKELLSGKAPNYKFTYIIHETAGANQNVLLVVSRLSGEIEPFLTDTARRSSLLRPLAPLF